VLVTRNEADFQKAGLKLLNPFNPSAPSSMQRKFQ